MGRNSMHTKNASRLRASVARSTSKSLNRTLTQNNTLKAFRWLSSELAWTLESIQQFQVYESKMATEAVRAHIAAKWQSSFTRLNRNQPGISGLLMFSEVRDFELVSESRVSLNGWCVRHGHSRASFSILEIYQIRYLRRNIVSPIALNDYAVQSSSWLFALDIQEVRAAFDTLSKSKMLPMMLESFLGML